MKKIVRLTESDLTRIVKRIISENEDEGSDYMYYIDSLHELKGYSKKAKTEIEIKHFKSEIRELIRMAQSDDELSEEELEEIESLGISIFNKLTGVVKENEDKGNDYPTSLKAAAKLWVKSDKDERRKIKAHILKTGVSPEKFLDAIGDVYESQW